MTSVTSENAQDRLSRPLAAIPNEHNRATVRRYAEERGANGIKPGTISYELGSLRDWCVFLGDKRLEDATRADVSAFVSRTSIPRTWRANRKDGSHVGARRTVTLSESTRALRRGVLKAFYRWLRGTETYPPEVAWMRVTRPERDSIPTDELVTPEDMKRLLQAHPHPRDLAILAVLYEAGFRAGELCALNVGSLTVQEWGVQLTLPKGVSGLKTGARVATIIDGANLVHAWWEAHPRKEDRDAPLFPIIGDKHTGQRLSPDDVWYFITTAGKRAGLSKSIHPHLFRHTAATNAARAGWTEAMMRAAFGWSKNSDMPSTYVHLAGKDYQEMLLEMRGLRKKGDGNGKPALAPQSCRSCQAPNMVTAKFCMRCRKPLSPEAEAEMRQRTSADLKEELASIVAASVKEQLAAELQRVLGTASSSSNASKSARVID